eukprot:12777804-Alexandrium_andersonii.AAC.1
MPHLSQQRLPLATAWAERSQAAPRSRPLPGGRAQSEAEGLDGEAAWSEGTGRERSEAADGQGRRSDVPCAAP